MRELVQRGVLQGPRGGYICRADVADVAVPATVQAAIEARIDRLTTPAKRTLNAASVIGARFGAQLLSALGIDPVFDELVNAELIDQVRFTASAEYAFRHPLIRAVAYESQLKSDRADVHRQPGRRDRSSGSPESADQNAALIAEHLQAAGELPSRVRLAHARRRMVHQPRHRRGASLSWERARQIADALPDDDPDRTAMRIAPRTMLCVTGWRVNVNRSPGRFEELRELCSARRGQGLAGHRHDRAGGRVSCSWATREEASRLASEQMALLESIGDPDPDHGAGVHGDRHLVRRPVRSPTSCGGRRPSSTWPTVTPPRAPASVVGSPLAVALAWRGVARWWLGRPGWRQDLDDAVAMARSSDPVTLAAGRHLEVRIRDTRTGCFGPMTPRCARSRRRCRPPRDQATITRWACQVHAGFRAGASGRRGRPSARAGAAGAGPRHVPARAVSTDANTGLRLCVPRGRGPGAATAMVPYR